MIEQIKQTLEKEPWTIPSNAIKWVRYLIGEVERFKGLYNDQITANVERINILVDKTNQIGELQKALKQLLSNAPENDVFDLYSSSESESEEWRSAKEFAYQAIERTETTGIKQINS